MTRSFRLSPRSLLFAAYAVTVIIGAFTVGYYLLIFPTYFRGWPEITPEHSVAGWAVNEAAPMTSVEVQLYVDNRFIADMTADMSRPDVVAAGRAKSDKCGFNFILPHWKRVSTKRRFTSCIRSAQARIARYNAWASLCASQFREPKL